MFVYVVVFILAVILASVAELGWNRRPGAQLPRGAAFAPALVGGVLTGVSALRWRVGTDYTAYERNFPDYAAEVPHELHLFEEPGIRIIAWLAMAINGDSATMFAIAAIITVGLSVGTIWRWSPAFSFGIAIYIFSGAWHGSFNGVRQYIAGAILFAGHRHIINRNFFKWFCVVFIAMLFHVSAIVGLLMYFIPTRKTSFYYQFVIILFGLIGMLGMGAILDFLESFTGDSNQWGGIVAERSVNPLRVVFALLPIAVFWIFNSREAVRVQHGWFYINMLVVYGATYIASLSSVLIARFAIYPLPFLAIGLALATSFKETRERAIIRSVLLVLYGVFFYIEVSSNADLNDFKWLFDRDNFV